MASNSVDMPDPVILGPPSHKQVLSALERFERLDDGRQICLAFIASHLHQTGASRFQPRLASCGDGPLPHRSAERRQLFQDLLASPSISETGEGDARLKRERARAENASECSCAQPGTGSDELEIRAHLDGRLLVVEMRESPAPVVEC